MGEAALVESQILDAITLIQKFDSEEISVNFAAWYFYHDASEWKLILSGNSFDKLLPRGEIPAYGIVVDAIKNLSLSSLNLSDIKLISGDSVLVKSLKFLMRTGEKGLARAHFIDTTLNGIFVKEVYILRSG
jgi:hypothetical protein